jgi:hypothetical protein
MGLAWFGNTDWCDDRCPEVAIEVCCTKCGASLIWNKPLNYDGQPPKHSCGGTVKRLTPGRGIRSMKYQVITRAEVPVAG